MLVFSEPQEFDYDGQKFYIIVPQVAENRAAALKEFQSEVSDASSMAQPYVLTVEPKEYAQNISDVAARQRVLSLEASLSAPIPQAGTSLGLDANYMRESQQMFDSIKRQPLVVGFVSGDKAFGWILGPQFAVNRTQLSWSHTPIQHSVQASVVVPGWWTSLSLVVRNNWLNDKALTQAAAGSDRFSVDLPGDYAALTRGLVGLHDKSLSPPVILPRWDADTNFQHFILKEGEDETILLQGNDLWRNPEVYIGSQQGTNIHILPDMKGITAEFSILRLPRSAKPGPQFADLTVVTSVGSEVLHDAVQILPKNPPATAVPFARLLSSFLVKGSETLQFDIDTNAVPKAFGQLLVTVKDTTQGTEIPSAVTANFPKGGPWAFTIPAAGLSPAITSGNSPVILVDLKTAATPSLSETPVSGLQSAPVHVAYFQTIPETQMKLAPPALTVAVSPTPTAYPYRLGLTIQTTPDLFRLAYPGFEDSLKNGTAMLNISYPQGSFTTNAVLNMVGGDVSQGAYALFYPPNHPNTTAAQTWNVSVTYPAAPPGGVITLNSGLTITWQ